MIKGLLYLAILTTAIALSWIGFSVYHSYTTTTITNDAAIAITPIPGEFDRATIEILRKKNKIPVDLNGERQGISSESETGSDTKTATAAASPSVTPVATNSASIEL